ncbi:MAG: DUF2391 family protein [Candidatus Woesearchaeota archaeon]
MREIEQIKRELDTVKYETDIIKDNVDRIKDKLIDHTPEHFSRQDLVRASIGAIFLGFSVLFSSNLVTLAIRIPDSYLLTIILSTILILTIEIYVIGYSRVKDKQTRKFGQFWLKRILVFYATALVIATMLALIFGLQFVVPSDEYFLGLVIILSAPCAIGASLGDLLKKY